MNHVQWKLNQDYSIFIPQNAFENIIYKIAAIL